jgi:hypothetical protein
MNRHLLQRHTGFSKPSIVLPKHEQINIQNQREQNQKVKEEEDFSNGLNKLCYALLRGQGAVREHRPPIPPPVRNVEPPPEIARGATPAPDVIMPSVKDKVTKTPSQLKIDAEKKKIDDKDAELLQEELNKKPEKPGERLLKKLVKKHVKKKIPSHIKKKVAKIREIEGKEHKEVSTNNKILDAIKSAYM